MLRGFITYLTREVNSSASQCGSIPAVVDLVECITLGAANYFSPTTLRGLAGALVTNNIRDFAAELRFSVPDAPPVVGDELDE
jgi:hypothetical protein